MKFRNRIPLHILDDIISEYYRAVKIHPYFPEDVIHGVAVMAEESGEAVRASLQYEYEGGTLGNVKEELVQTAATCIRNLINLEGRE